MNGKALTRQLTGGLVIVIGLLVLINQSWLNLNAAPWLWILLMAAAAVVYGWIFVRSRDSGAALGAYVSAAIALIGLLTTQVTINGIIVPVLVLSLIGLPFLHFGLRSPKQRGLLVPAYVMFVLALMLALIEGNIIADELVPAYVMAAIGLPFLLAAFMTREWGFLIPAAIMLGLGFFFVANFAGLSIQFVTVGLPLLLIIIGLFMILRPPSQRRKIRQP